MYKIEKLLLNFFLDRQLIQFRIRFCNRGVKWKCLMFIPKKSNYFSGIGGKYVQKSNCCICTL
jgi:hypothetical protein